MRPIKLLISLALIPVLYSTSAASFEIKPICPNPRGAYCKKANTNVIHYTKTSNACESSRNYAIKGKNQPVHEAITRQAYEAVFTKPLNGYNFSNALISGVEWNDDPEQLIRKVFLGDGLKHVTYFAKVIDEQPLSRITTRSHYGDMQFLHSMRPSDRSEASPDEIKQIIYDWIKHTYEVATGKMPYNTPIDESYFNTYFKMHHEYKDISDIFDPRKMLVSNNYAKTVQMLASGSILHIIQDSYSESHTKRNSESGRLEDFLKYPNDHHCIKDAAHEENRASIERAISVSSEYMRLKDANASWCSEMGPFIKRIFSADFVKDSECDNLFAKQ